MELADRDKLRGVLNIVVLMLAGYVMGTASEKGDVLTFTCTLILATVAVGIISVVLGPMQRGDERMLKRSEEAALLSVRICAFAGLLAFAYSAMLEFEKMSLLFLGMAVPGMVWVVLYFVLVWRDVR